MRQWDILLFPFLEEQPHPVVIVSPDDRCQNPDLKYAVEVSFKLLRALALAETLQVIPFEITEFLGAAFFEKCLGTGDIAREPFLMDEGDPADVGGPLRRGQGLLQASLARLTSARGRLGLALRDSGLDCPPRGDPNSGD